MRRFGPFEVDFKTSEMRKSGVRIRIQEQRLRILEILLEHPGELVTREQLRDRLWPSDTFVDFERSLNAAVAKLRQSLNDSADQPLYIETVARKGYRFIAPVIETAVEPEPVTISAPPIPPPARRGRLIWLAAGVLVFAAAVSWKLWRPPSTVSGKPMVWLDLDTAKDVSQPAISSDGMTSVFVANHRLAVRRFDRGNITPLEGTEGASSPFLSPDGQWIGYFADHKLRKVPAGGGESSVLCDAPMDHGGTWAEDGQIVAALSASGELSTVPASGGTPRPFSDLRNGPQDVTSHRWPRALPDGKGVLYVAGTGVATGSLQVMPLRGGRAKTLVDNSSTGGYVAGGYLLFYRGRSILTAPMNLDSLELTGPASPFLDAVAYDHFRGAEFDVSSSGTLIYRRTPPAAHRAVMWLDSSGVGERIVAEPGAYTSPRLSPDGKYLALTSESDGRQKVWIYDLARKTMMRLAFGTDVQCCPMWTPEGDYVVFTSGAALAWAQADGSGRITQLPGAGGVSVPWSFSPDGKWLAFHRNEPQTGFDLWLSPVTRKDGELRLGVPQPLLRQPGLQAAPAISPDGRWLAYASDESGRQEVYVAPFSPSGSPSDSKWMVSTEGGRAPRWSQTGDEIFFRSLDDHLMAVTGGSKANAFLADKPRLWFEKRLANVGGPPNFDVAPKGKCLIALIDTEETGPEETHLRVLLNVDDELRRQHARQVTAKAPR